MKHKIVLIEFPYDGLSNRKIRPAYCLTEPVGEYRYILFALITSKIPTQLLATDFVLDPTHPDFATSGLRKPSTIRPNYLITLRRSTIQRQLGELSLETHTQSLEKLREWIEQ